MQRRVWCETLSFAEVTAPSVLALLARYRLDVLLAVRPWQLGEIGEAVARLRGAGLWVAVWPMLADSDGRWASVRSSQAFIALVDQVVAHAPEADEVVVDLEPPLLTMAAWQSGRPQLPTRGPVGFANASAAMVAAINRWRVGPTRPRRITTALMPMLAFEQRGTWMQRMLGTPATVLPVDGHSIMAYTSLLEGWSRGLVHRQRAEQLLGACARKSRQRFGDLAGLSVGAVGIGAFGDEPAYRRPDELARDVRIATDAGITSLSLFELGGVLRRGPAEAWLDSFTGE